MPTECASNAALEFGRDGVAVSALTDGQNQIVDPARRSGQVLGSVEGGEDPGESRFGHEHLALGGNCEVLGSGRLPDVLECAVTAHGELPGVLQPVELGEGTVEHHSRCPRVVGGEEPPGEWVVAVHLGTTIGEVRPDDLPAHQNGGVGGRSIDLSGDDQAFLDARDGAGAWD